MESTTLSPRLARTLQPSAAIGFAVLSAGLWWGWFAWDVHRDIDPVTLSASGPYEPWQVAGCVVSWALLAWLGNKVLKPAVLVLVMPSAFTAAWILTAVQAEDPGMWPIGAVLVAAGTLAGTAGFTALLRRFSRPRKKSGLPASEAVQTR